MSNSLYVTKIDMYNESALMEGDPKFQLKAAELVTRSFGTSTVSVNKWSASRDL